MDQIKSIPDIESDSDAKRYRKLQELLSMQERIKNLIVQEETNLEKKQEEQLKELVAQMGLNTNHGKFLLNQSVNVQPIKCF